VTIELGEEVNHNIKGQNVLDGLAFFVLYWIIYDLLGGIEREMLKVFRSEYLVTREPSRRREM